jgi:hypothetical protein
MGLRGGEAQKSAMAYILTYGMLINFNHVDM